MVRTIVWFIFFWLILIYLIPAQLKAKRYEKAGEYEKKNEYVYKKVRMWARSLVWLAGGKIKVTGQDNIPKDGAVVFISNHQGNFDVPIFLGFIDKSKAFIAKKETEKLPFISSWMKLFNCVFMDRNDIRQAVQAINEGVEILKQGQSLIIFPEGTRSKGDKMGEFKSGSFKLATKAGVPIIPVTIKGSYRLMEERKFIIRPAEVEIIISKPIETSNLTREEIHELPGKIKEIIQSNY